MKWENIFTNSVPDKGLLSRVYKELLQFNNNNNKNQLIMSKEFKKPSLQRSTQLLVSMFFTSLIIRKLQIKTTMRHPFTTLYIVTVKNQKTVSAEEDVEKLETWYTVGGNVKCCSSNRKQNGSCSDNQR